MRSPQARPYFPVGAALPPLGCGGWPELGGVVGAPPDGLLVFPPALPPMPLPLCAALGSTLGRDASFLRCSAPESMRGCGDDWGLGVLGEVGCGGELDGREHPTTSVAVTTKVQCPSLSRPTPVVRSTMPFIALHSN